MARNRKGSKIDGWLVLDKPLGLSSTQALGKARHWLGAQKAGHGGTLDPLASGLLPLAFGEATKLVPYIMDGVKTYHFTVRWGEARSTDDAEGAVTATSSQRPTLEKLNALLPGFLGQQWQKPPAFSALKLDGRRAYALARAGETVELAPRQVQIFDLKLISVESADEATLSVTCGKGTYVRALARDLALGLGTVGHVTALRRTRVGPFDLEQAISLDKLAELAHKGEALTALRPIATVLDDIPAFAVDLQAAQQLRHGQAILAASPETAPHVPTMLALFQDQPVAIVAWREGMWQPVRGFNL